jgi:uncharacterized protein (DUF2267 family)
MSRVLEDQVVALRRAEALFASARVTLHASGFDRESATLPKAVKGRWRMTEVWRDGEGNTIVLRHRFRVPPS